MDIKEFKISIIQLSIKLLVIIFISSPSLVSAQEQKIKSYEDGQYQIQEST